MGFLFAPHEQQAAKDWLSETMQATKARLETSLPFAMDPVVYDFRINDRGTWGEWLAGDRARLPDEYYAQMLPGWLRLEPRQMTPHLRGELELVADATLGGGDRGMSQRLLRRLLPQPAATQRDGETLEALLAGSGFDRAQHELIREELRSGRIGLAQNRLPANALIEDVRDSDVHDARNGVDPRLARIGEMALRSGAAAVLTLAAGVGSRWTEGAGVVKALHPFCQFAGRHRRFLDVHLAKTRQTARRYGAPLPHVFTTSYLTDGPIRDYLAAGPHDPAGGPVEVSPGRAVGLRLVPMVRDLLFAWEEMPQQVLDQQRQKVRASLRAALVEWARAAGEGTDYTDNLPRQCLHPVGHWYEVPNLLRNGTLRLLLQRQPALQYLLLHNIDTLGANVDPALLGRHIDAGGCLTYEVISRRLDDRGGGLARVDGRVRLVEGLALAREEDEFRLRFYNTLTTWITIDRLLAVFGLTRADLADDTLVDEAVRRLGQRLPTYITIKDVKKRWGQGQEDVFPVTQFERLWGDMTVLPEVDCRYVVVPLFRGQQLKHPAQLDGWLRDGSADYVHSLCAW